MDVRNIKHGEETREEILRVITDYVIEHCYPPSIREIGKMVGLKSTSTVHSHLQIMLENGMLETDYTQGSGASRALRVPGYKFVKIEK